MSNMFGNNNDYNSSSSKFGGTQVGGGFVQNENFNSSNNNFSKPNVVPYEQRKLAQITIKQIITAPPPQPDEPLSIDGQQISQVSMIAQIQSINIQSSHTTLKVNDYTGTLDAKQWHNDDNAQQPQSSNLVQGTWVHIVGRINCYQGRCSINVFQIIPVTRFDEITHHYLECIFAHLTNTTNAQNIDNKQINNNQNNFNQNNANNYNNNNNGTNYNNNNGNNGNNFNYDNGLSLLQNKVLAIINTPEMEQNETGCDVSILFKRLPNEDVNEIRNAIDELATAGHLYSTVDEDHYKYSGDQ